SSRESSRCRRVSAGLLSRQFRPQLERTPFTLITSNAPSIHGDVTEPWIDDARPWRQAVRAGRTTRYYRALFEATARRLGHPASVIDLAASLSPTSRDAFSRDPSAFLADDARPIVIAATTGTRG